MKQEFKEYTLAKDYPLAGKKAGETVKLAKVSNDIKPYLEGYESEDEDEDEVPTEKWTKFDIVAWLASKGVTAEGTKEDLLKEVKKVSK